MFKKNGKRSTGSTKEVVPIKGCQGIKAQREPVFGEKPKDNRKAF